MKRFRMDREPDCRRCHKLVGIILKDGIYHVTCSVSDKEIGKARIPSYCIRKQDPANGQQMAGKKEEA